MKETVDSLGAGRTKPAERVPLYVYVVTAAIFLQFMSGHSEQFGLPIAPDRILLPIGFLLFWRHADCRARTWRLRPIHVLLVATSVWCLASMIATGTVNDSRAVFAFVDAFGVVPFALYVISPVVYGTKARRKVFALAMAALGLYLGAISVMQGFGIEDLIWPPYIIFAESSHYGRAFGPSLQVGSNGLQLFACLCCSAVLWAGSSKNLRVLSGATVLLCTAGLFFTLTRSVWLGAVSGVFSALVLHPRTRRLIPRAAVLAVGSVTALLVGSPSLRRSVAQRLLDASTAYDRIDANATAFDIVAQRPEVGVGFSKFYRVQGDWFWQSDVTPVAETGIAVHNVLLGHAAELGIPGATLWLCCLIVASTPLFRALPSDMEALAWRQVVVAFFTYWAVQAMLIPITYPQPSSLLWVMLGMISKSSDLGFSEPRSGQLAGSIPVGR